MNFLFSRTYKYTINKPIGKVLQDLSKVTNKKWIYSSENITGTINEENNFKFTHKWTLGYVRGIFGSDFAILKGKVNDDGQRTVIKTTIRPNLGLVFFIYFMAALFLCELFGIRTMLIGPKAYILLFLPFFGLIIIGLILFMTNGLRSNFEKVFQLQAD